jgi:hypothetical protein
MMMIDRMNDECMNESIESIIPDHSRKHRRTVNGMAFNLQDAFQLVISAYTLQTFILLMKDLMYNIV